MASVFFFVFFVLFFWLGHLQHLTSRACRCWNHHPFLQERDQEIEGLYAALEKKTEATSAPASVPHVDTEGPRRSQRLITQTEQGRLQAELDQCRTELLTKTVGKLTETLLFWCQDCVFFIYCLFVLSCAELTQMKSHFEVPGSTGTLTSAADRKLEEGQRVSSCSAVWSTPLFLLWGYSSSETELTMSPPPNRTYGSCAWICRNLGRACSQVNEPAAATQGGKGCGRHWRLQMRR